MTDKLFLGDTPEQLNVKCANWVDVLVIDGLAYTTEKVKELLKERDVLAAQVNFLLEVIDSSGAYKVCQELCDARHKTPQQCLRDVQAEAGRAGFIAGFKESGEGFNGEYGASEKRIYQLADEYIESVRQGGAE